MKVIPEMKPTRNQFMAYVKVQKSGATNMFDVNKVCRLAGNGLNKMHCMYIFTHYNELKEEYGID